MKTDSDKTKEQLLKENDLLRQRISKLEIRENNLKKEEEALIESEKKLREARKMAHLGFWYWDVKTGDVEWSDEIYGIFQLDPEKFKPQIDSILALSSKWPEDSQRGDELIRKAVESKEQGSYEQRFLLPDGSTGYYESSFQGIYDADGELTAMKGTVLDITKHKRAEKELYKSEKKYRLMFDNMINGLAYHKIVTNKEGKPINYTFLEINNAFEKLTGLKGKDIIGKNVTEALPGIENDSVDWIERYGQVALTGKGIRFENFAEALNMWYSVFAYSPQKGYFTTVFEDITKRKRAEKELQEFAAVIKYSGELVNMSDMEGKMTFLNEAGCKMLGIDPQEVDHFNIMDVIPEHLTELVESELLPALIREGLWEGDLQYRNQQTGNLIDVHTMAFSIKDPKTQEPLFLANVSMDITERKKAEDELKKYREKLETLVIARTEELEKQNKELSSINEQLTISKDKIEKSEERFNLVIQATHDGIWDWDIETNKEYYSPRWCEIIGFSYEDPEFEHTYESWSERIHPDDYDGVMHEIELHFKKDKPYNVEYKHLNKSGEYRWLNSTGKAIKDRNGKPVRMVGRLTDITERKELETALKNLVKNQDVIINAKTAELSSANKELNSNIEDLKLKEKRLAAQKQQLATDLSKRLEVENALKETNKFLHDMVYIASHDLQVPLVSMEGYASELLKNNEDKLDEEAVYCLTRLKTNAQRMHKLVISLLDISRLNTQIFPHEVFSLETIINKIIDDISLTVEKHNATIKIGKLPKLFADKQRIETVIRNLIVNSLNYEGKIIDIEYSGNVLSISDNGIGIPPSQLEKIFNPGERLKMTKAEGVGMGLTFCKKVIEQHNSKIWAESDGKNRGAKINIEFNIKNLKD